MPPMTRPRRLLHPHRHPCLFIRSHFEGFKKATKKATMEERPGTDTPPYPTEAPVVTEPPPTKS